jgi:hypothetical protein
VSREVPPVPGERVAGRLPYLAGSEARGILLVWAVWGAGTVLFASAAMTLPVADGSPWTVWAHAPPLARWDSGWYLSVARDGYQYDAKQPENNVGFYPLYPLAARALSTAVHVPIMWAGIALSLACAALALLLIADLFAEWGGPGAGLAGAATLLAYPTAFFLAAFYTESLFLLCAAAAIWGARRGRWAVAGLGGFLGALTRFNGFLLLVPLAIAAILARRRGDRGAAPWLATAASVAGAAAFPVYLWHRWGDPLLYVHSKIRGWPVRPAAPWTLFGTMAREAGGHALRPLEGGKLVYGIEMASVALLIAGTYALFRARRLPEAGYAAATLLLLLSSGTHSGVARYALVVFPCYAPLAEILRRRPPLALAYAFLGCGTGVILLHRYVHWIFVG